MLEPTSDPRQPLVEGVDFSLSDTDSSLPDKTGKDRLVLTYRPDEDIARVWEDTSGFYQDLLPPEEHPG